MSRHYKIKVILVTSKIALSLIYIFSKGAHMLKNQEIFNFRSVVIADLEK